MKYILIVVFILGAGYHLYDKYKPTTPPPPVPQQPQTPQAQQVPQAPVQPDMSVIYIKGRSKITNCIVKSVTKDSIMFVSDQGLVQGRFQDLPPEFYAYYKSQITPTYTQPQPLAQVRENAAAERKRKNAAAAAEETRTRNETEAENSQRLAALMSTSKQVARNRVYQFYNYEYHPGSGSVYIIDNSILMWCKLSSFIKSF